jgi:hypothetical protein
MSDADLRHRLVESLRGGNAFMTFDQAVADFPEGMINTRPTNVEYTFWHLLEHIRISQWDILDFSRNPGYQEIEWPKDYWPAKDAQATATQWQETIRQIEQDTREMIQLVRDEATDLHTPFSWGQGQNLVREAILVANHNAYHIGEFAILRQVMNAWPKGHR